MRTLIKSGFSVVTAGLLVFSLHAGAADASKGKYKDPVDPALAQCQTGCMTFKEKGDYGVYESCMIKCSKDHKKNATPAMPKK